MKTIAAACLMAAASARHHHHHVRDLVQLQDDPLFNSNGYITTHYKGEDDNKPPTDYPINYEVPNFGQDTDVATTLRNAGDAEKELGHFWDAAKKPAKPHPTDYFVPNFGQDEDVKNVNQSLNAAEKQVGAKWKWKNYVPPNRYEMLVPYYQQPRGLDDDVTGTLKNLNAAEVERGHKYSLA